MAITGKIKDWGREWLSAAVYGALRRRAKPMVLTDGPAVVFAPHADDETLGCGGLIAMKVAAGAPVRIVILTDGASAADDVPDRRRAITDTREGEALAATAALGLAAEQVTFLRLPDGRLGALGADFDDARDRIAAILRADRPEEVYVTHRRDRHCDHVAAFQLVRAALTQWGGPARLFEYPIWLVWWSGLGLRLRPADLRRARRLSIGPAIDRKVAALQTYESQLNLLPQAFVGHFLKRWELFFEQPHDDRWGDSAAAVLAPEEHRRG